MAGFLKFSSIALKNLFSKPATRAYPDLPPKSTAATRGSVQIDIDQCVLCGLCMRRCPSEAIKVDRATKTWTIERMGCVQCGDCLSICPKQCLSMDPKYTPPSATKTVHTYQKEEPAQTPDEIVASNKSDRALLMNMNDCVLCGLCVKQCPVGAIKVDRATKTWTIERAECLLCGACAQRCPKKCLTVGAPNGEMPSIYLKDSAPAAPAAASTAAPTAVQPEGQAAGRSALLMNMDDCVLCGLCVKQCPVGAITVDRATKIWTIERDECLLCGACAGRCPKKCLSIGETSEAVPSVYTKTPIAAPAATVQTPAPSEATSAPAISDKPSALSVNMESCVLCGLCAKQCPVSAIKVDRTAKTWAIDRDECLLCAACVQRCPKKCITLEEATDALLQTSVFTKTVAAVPAAEEKLTAQMPAAPKPTEHKSALHIGIENCVLCGMCVKQCPVGAIKVDRAAKTWTIDRSACLLCGACVGRCPKKCLGIGHASDSTMQTSTYTKS